MSAGTGIFHSEFNLESEDKNLFQIWIEPNKLNVKPTWDSFEFPKEAVTDSLILMVSGDGNAPLSINQDSQIYAGTLSAGSEIQHSIKHQVYLLVSEGSVEVDGQVLTRGDGLEVENTSSITLKALQDSEVLVLDVPPVA
jgi:quercetin 2,3-dioxygenase